MKEKIKPMAIYGGIGAASGAAIAYFMNKKDIKNIMIFAGTGLALGAIAGYFMSIKEEDKSGAAGVRTVKRCQEYDTNGKCTSWENVPLK